MYIYMYKCMYNIYTICTCIYNIYILYCAYCAVYMYMHCNMCIVLYKYVYTIYVNMFIHFNLLNTILCICKYIYLYTLAISPSLGGSRQHKRNKQKQWGFHSVLPAMTRDPAEFGWHCWSNTAHPPPSSTTYVAS